MKFFHISDLHLGKRLKAFSLIEDQQDILIKIAELAKEHKPDAVLIAGDVFDKPTPSIEAIQLLDRFLVWLNELGIVVFMISGNHDSAERVSFAADLLKNSNVHIVPSYNGKIEPIRFFDDYGDVFIWMLPYLRPAIVRKHFEDREISSYNDALSAVISNMQTDASVRNVLIAHQFITGGETSDEEIYVGNSENIDSSVFADFDYVALGHLHRPQYIERESLRYCGSPLKYSLSEANHDKTVTVVDMADKIETPKISLLPLNPIHDVREIRGTYAEIMNRKNYRGTNIDDFVHIVLTDEDEEFDAMAKLRAVYPNLLDLVYDNTRTQTEFSLETTNPAEGKMPLELLGEFYENQNGIPMSEEQLTYAENLFTEIFKEIIL